jgi:DNA polymerase
MPEGESGNRQPTDPEMQTCLPWLHAQIDIIQPKVLVALGAVALRGLLPELSGGITKLRGRWLLYRNIPMMPTYHPAYLLRNQSIAEKRKVWEDMLAVLERLGRPITPKMQNYFKGE